MSVAFLNARAHLILRQRLIEADEARMAKRVCALRRTKRKLQRAMVACLRNDLAMDAVIDELTLAYRCQGLATSE